MSSQLSSNDKSTGAGFDWRAQASEHPLAFSAGALAAGLLVGYSLGGALGGEQAAAQGSGDSAPAAGQTAYASGQQDWPLNEASGKTGLIEKIKGTQAFDRLQEEVATLGDRLLNELSRAGREIVLPALVGKLTGLLGAEGASTAQTQNARQSDAKP